MTGGTKIGTSSHLMVWKIRKSFDVDQDLRALAFVERDVKFQLPVTVTCVVRPKVTGCPLPFPNWEPGEESITPVSSTLLSELNVTTE